MASSAKESHPPLGLLLREWRGARRMSQLDLALEADLSPRHLGFIETGKSHPSREAVARLADALRVPLRERNALLLAAGYAPHHPESELATPALEHMRQAIDLILSHQEPYPAFVLNRYFDVLGANDAAVRINQLVMGDKPSVHANLLHQIFDPADFRRVILNWPDVAARFIRQLHEELVATPFDMRARALLDDVLAYPEVPQGWRTRDIATAPTPIVTLTFASPLGPLRFFETITTFAAPRDVTLDELRIDCAFPADTHTAEVCARLAKQVI
jgi:transcriptional regulator with XRE-family HTH domain